MKVGDVVQLKSGGPAMTVTSVFGEENELIECFVATDHYIDKVTVTLESLLAVPDREHVVSTLEKSAAMVEDLVSQGAISGHVGHSLVCVLRAIKRDEGRDPS